MSDYLFFRAVVIGVEGNKNCRVYPEEDVNKTPILGYMKESLSTKKKHHVLRPGDIVLVRMSETDQDKCLIVKKINDKLNEEGQVNNTNKKKNNNKRFFNKKR